MVERIVVGRQSTNAYLFSSWKKECVLIDPGGDTEKIIGQMSMKNMHPRGIILTHGHLDHILALAEIVQHYAEKGIHVPVAIHELDAKYLGPRSTRVHKHHLDYLNTNHEEVFGTTFAAAPKPDEILQEGSIPFDSDLRVIHTPGHTPGSICLYCESQELLFSGDTLFADGAGRTDLPGSSRKEIVQSITQKLFTLPHSTRVFPGHGPISSIERAIKQYKP